MNARPEPGVDLVLLWHHHQPDYRDPADGRALLPWVRLHATKDYLDMALTLERHPGVRCTFNFVPSLLDQLEAAASGGTDALFELLKLGVEDLSPLERAEVTRRCASAPPHALERWPAFRALAAKAGTGGELGDSELLALETYFLVAWLDPSFFGEPEAARAIAAAPRFDRRHRDDVLELHDRLVARVIPAYRDLARRGQIELSASPYDHPILPLLIDVRSARRARPQMPLPIEPFAAPEDASRQIVRARARHAQAFGAEPQGLWPSEGSVSPEAVTIAARQGVRWMASDEAVLWHSLDPDARRESVYRPWRVATEDGGVVMFFRDHELSDRIGFVYSHWNPDDAAQDFVARLRRVAEENTGPVRPVVTVALDGENCWEHYADDGGPFLDALYDLLASDPMVRTRTPSQVIDDGPAPPTLERLHSGSWIDADFHIWIGHPEKNRAWDLLARTRRALVEAGSSPVRDAPAWESLDAAEGSDWFWWMGDDHYTPDKSLFDHLFRSHLRAAHERADLPVPAWLDVPVAPQRLGRPTESAPIGFLAPEIDGESTHYYEWHNAGRFRLGDGGGSMHREGGRISDLRFGYDARTLYLRVDFARREDDAPPQPPGADWDLELELLVPRSRRLRVARLVAGPCEVVDAGTDGKPRVVEGARCAIRRLLELAIPFQTLGLEAGESAELVVRLLHRGQVLETAPADDLIRVRVPDDRAVLAQWSA
jgi:alpha-amylase/alpha-mannosidase (GH57 family)